MSRTAYILATIGVLAVVPAAFASAGGHLGVDVSKAGDTKAEHMAFVEQMKAPDRYNLEQACKKQINLLTGKEKTFCTSIIN